MRAARPASAVVVSRLPGVHCRAHVPCLNTVPSSSTERHAPQGSGSMMPPPHHHTPPHPSPPHPSPPECSGIRRAPPKRPLVAGLGACRMRDAPGEGPGRASCDLRGLGSTSAVAPERRPCVRSACSSAHAVVVAVVPTWVCSAAAVPAWAGLPRGVRSALRSCAYAVDVAAVPA